MKFVKKVIFHRAVIIGVLIVLQALFLLGMLSFLSEFSRVFYVLGLLISILAVLWIVYNDINPAYKIAWVIPIVMVPIFGGLFYITFSGTQLSRKEKARMSRMLDETKKNLRPNESINIQDVAGRQQVNYLQSYGPYPVYENTRTQYYPLGEICYEDMKNDLNSAKKFIFMEYFIIEEGEMWQDILEILEEKAKAGLDVRLIFDDLGCLVKLPSDYHKQLRKKGIKCQVFNPLVPVISSKYNTRDHRKIMVIDGHTAYTGGINLADEYINAVEKLGHWKDMAVKLEGESVWSFTVMFLSMWDYLADEKSTYENFKYSGETIHAKGYVLPYSDNPLDSEAVGENVYLNMINKAEKYICITTPYLVISSEMLTALCNAAKNGVDVTIITPHIPDKWYVHLVSWSYYDPLIKSGVKIAEYTPGFMHGKNVVVDDRYAVVGTINMDFRSLYLHFECAMWMMDTDSVIDVKEDFYETLEVSKYITESDLKSIKWYEALFGLILRLFAPLM